MNFAPLFLRPVPQCIAWGVDLTMCGGRTPVRQVETNTYKFVRLETDAG